MTAKSTAWRASPRVPMKGRRDLVWIGQNGISHRLRTYERWADGIGRTGTTVCGKALDLAWQDLHKGDPTCMACVAAGVLTG